MTEPNSKKKGWYESIPTPVNASSPTTTESSVKAEETIMSTDEVKSVPMPEAKPTVLVSNTDAYIWDRMKGQPKTLKEVDVRVEEKRDPNRHRLSLPKEIEAYEKKYTFRWIFKRKQAIDDACDIKGWVLVNQWYFPDLPKHLFTSNGSVERGDNILAFMSREKAEEIRRKPGELSRAAVKARFEAHKGDPNYYVPSDEETGRNVVGI